MPSHDCEYANQCLSPIKEWKGRCTHARHQMPFVEGIALLANLLDQPVDGSRITANRFKPSLTLIARLMNGAVKWRGRKAA